MCSAFHILCLRCLSVYGAGIVISVMFLHEFGEIFTMQGIFLVSGRGLRVKKAGSVWAAIADQKIGCAKPLREAGRLWGLDQA
jgi:hypothetical protein